MQMKINQDQQNWQKVDNLNWQLLIGLFFEYQYYQVNQIYHIILVFMNIIVRDGLALFKNKKAAKAEEISHFVQNHLYYHSQMSSYQITHHILAQLSHHHPKNQQTVKQMELYLNRSTNQQLFSVLQYILLNPKGVSYTQITQKFKIDKINASHYCCKLRKMKFIRWQHLKQGMGVIVFPNIETNPNESLCMDLQANEQVQQRGFCFRQLSMIDNIWVNVSAADTSISGGITNQEIKNKILKNAQTKMVRRSLEYFKSFEKVAERQGKVYEFKYRNQTEQIKTQINRKRGDEQMLEPLHPSLQIWLRSKFPEYSGENFLLDLINDRLKEYQSSLGTKLAKRQCTPLKLSRYVKILNYLDKYGPQTQVELRRFVVEYQKDLNNGKMHKRSLVGILQGLKKLQIVKEDAQIYIPSWIDCQSSKKTNPKYGQRQLKQQIKNKKIKPNESQLSVIMVSKKKHRLDLFAKYLQIQLESIFHKTIKQAFYRIKNSLRKKPQSNSYHPQVNIISLIESPQISLGDIQSTNYGQLLQEIDSYVSLNGHMEHQIDTSVDLIRFFRKHVITDEIKLKYKFGKNWRQRLQSLIFNKLITIQDDQVKLSLQNKKYLV